MNRTKVLYISYDGMLEPLGQSQVLAYLKQLSSDHSIWLISYEKRGDWQDRDRVQALQQEVRGAGIHWHPLRYHKRPSALATAWDILVGIVVGTYVLLRSRASVVHARSYVAAVMALAIKQLTGAKFVFDMRGFWADERLDGGIWAPRSRMYRIAKYLERRFLLRADHVVSLTHAGVRELERFDYLAGRMPAITVIPTCADLKRFSPPASERDPEPLVLGYVGSAGTWYLFDETVRCFAELRRLRPSARLLIVNRGEHAFIRERLAQASVPPAAFDLLAVNHPDVPALLARMHAGVFFIKPVFSKQASAPTKLAEFLGCGVPCLGNAGVGDMAEILEGDRVGIALQSFDSASLQDGLRRLLALVQDPGTRERCVRVAHKYFSLDEGVRRYRSVYRQVTGSAAT